MTELGAPLLQAMAAHAEKAYPAECCGVLVSDSVGGLQYIAIENIAGSAAGAATSTRTVRDGYVMDPKGLMDALASAEEKGGGLRASPWATSGAI